MTEEELAEHRREKLSLHHGPTALIRGEVPTPDDECKICEWSSTFGMFFFLFGDHFNTTLLVIA